MTSTTRYILIGVGIVILAVAAYTVRDNSRTGTEAMTAEQVVDLEVAAQQEFEANGGKYTD